MASVEELLNLLATRGHSQYGGESVTQLEHALQAATLAENELASPTLIVAALLHDVGHLLHQLPDHAPDEGIDDRHESSGYHVLSGIMPTAVVDPVRMHVAAKRYLCAIDSSYFETLSEPSVLSLRLQGGPMTDEEVRQFRENDFAEDAVRLRRWDDQAKVPDMKTPPLEHFAEYVRQVAHLDRKA